jgi:hypothetical protein
MENKFTVEDLKELKRQLDNADIPAREYYGIFLLTPKEIDEFIEGFGIRHFLSIAAKDKINFMRKAIIGSDLTLEDKLDKWGIEILKEVKRQELDFSCGDEIEFDAKSLYIEVLK